MSGKCFVLSDVKQLYITYKGSSAVWMSIGREVCSINHPLSPYRQLCILTHLRNLVRYCLAVVGLRGGPAGGPVGELGTLVGEAPGEALPSGLEP